MKYLVNRETKEHVAVDRDVMLDYSPKDWRIVEADEEGWIKWDGGECPLPDGVACDIKDADSDILTRIKVPSVMRWSKIGSGGDIIAYRPILDEQESVVKESLTTEQCYGKADGYVPPLQYDPRSASFNVLKRLEAAHEAAQKIPDLEAELRDVLGRMGYDLVARSPFVEQPDEIPSDRWAKGYLVTCVDNEGMEKCLTVGRVYQVARNHPDLKRVVIEMGNRGRAEECSSYRFKFHSRP